MKDYFENANYCVCCGEIIPEGRWVCPSCEKNPTHTYQHDPGKRNKREKKRDRGHRRELNLLDEMWR